MHRFRSPNRSNTSVSIKKETISAPIPIPDDDEFPIRTPGASIATPLVEGVEPRISFQEPASPRRSIAEVISEPVPREQVASPLSQHFDDVPQFQPEPERTKRMSTSSQKSRTTLVKPQRKKSTLKTFMGKLFGRKRKGSGSTASKRESNIPNAQHQSQPVTLNRPAHPGNYSSQRSASLPINEFNRALRSHSVVLEDFPLRASYTPNRDSVKTEHSFTRPRGATTPSRPYDHIKTPIYGDWTGLSPRPASSHARGSNTISQDDGMGEVGVAVTSDSLPQSNRRSRSLGELRGVSLDYTTRKRSDEIKYWRQSQGQEIVSPSSGYKADDEPAVEEIENSSNKENFAPPEPFNFEPHLTEMAGMKITQAASLESRVSYLEDRLLNIEHHLQSTRPMTGNSEVSLPKHIHRASPQRPIRASQSRDTANFSFVSSHPSQTRSSNNISNQASFESYIEPINPPLGTYHHNAPRPLSTSTTIRAGTTHQTSSPITKESTLTMEHYTTLINMITAEQTARQTLQDLVQDLQQDVYALRNTLPLTNGHSQVFENEIYAQDEEVFKTPMETSEGYGEGIFGEVSGNRGPGFERKKTLSLGQITQNGTQKGAAATNF